MRSYNGGNPRPAVNIQKNIFDLSGSATDTVGAFIVGGNVTINVEDNIFYKPKDFGIDTWANSSTSTFNIRRNIFTDSSGGRNSVRLQGSSAAIYNIENNMFMKGNSYANSTVFSDQLTGAVTLNITRNLMYKNFYGGSADALLSIKSDTAQNFILNYNTIIDNQSPYAISTERASGAADTNAQFNYWGTTNPSEISGFIFDNSDDFSLATIDTSNYLATPDVNAPIIPPQNITVDSSGTGTVTFSWDANLETDIAGYRVYYANSTIWPYNGTGATEGSSGIDVGNNTTYTLSGLTPGSYYFFVTAYDSGYDGDRDQTDGNESWYSEQQYVYIP